MNIYEPRLLIEAYSDVYQSQDVDNELYEQVVEFLINEGYAEDQDDADALIEELSDEEIDGIIDEARGEGSQAATPGTQLYQQLFRGVKKEKGSKKYKTRYCISSRKRF